MDMRIRSVPVTEAALGADAGPPDLKGSPDGTPPLLNSQDVLRGHKTVAITHNGALYRLQTTRQGKLILTK